jgi:hypothetical protein
MPQTFKGRFGMAKLEEVLRLLALDTADNLPELLQTLGRNKKKLDDTLVHQMAIDNRAVSPASAANEYTKPTLSTHIIDLFRSHSWAATGELVTDGIMPFNITFASETSARAVSLRVTKLVAIESGSSAMSYSNAETFLVDKSMFPANTTACGYRLQAHSILVDLMLGELAPFAIAYRQCISDLRSHFKLSLKVHYGDLGGGAYHIALQILYWITQQYASSGVTPPFQTSPASYATSTPRHWMASSGACRPPGWSKSTPRVRPRDPLAPALPLGVGRPCRPPALAAPLRQ